MMLLVLAMACLGIDRFEDRYSTEFCAYAKECEVLDLEGFPTMKACEDQAQVLPKDCETYDRKKAQTCLDEVAQMTCEAGQAGLPSVCDQVCS